MLRCSRCKESKPSDQFGVSRSRSTGYQAYCKPCNSAAGVAWAKANAEHVEELRTAWRFENRSRLNDQARAWRQEHPESVRKKKRRHYARHRERLNVERLQRHHDNIEQSRARQRKWAAAHPLQCADNRARRRARLRGQAVGPVDYGAIVARDQWACYLCGERIKEGDHHFDHVIPLAKGGPHSIDNIRLTHAACNRRKSIKAPEVSL